MSRYGWAIGLMLAGATVPAAANELKYCLDGAVSMREGKNQEAIENFTRCILQGKLAEPNLVQAYYQRAIAAFRMQAFADAISDYSAAIKMRPELSGLYNERGNAYALQGDFNAAVHDYGKAIELDSENADAFFNRGNARSLNGEPDLALLDFTRAIDIDPTVARVWAYRGLVYERKGQTDQATQDMERAYALDNTPPWVRDKLITYGVNVN